MLSSWPSEQVSDSPHKDLHLHPALYSTFATLQLSPSPQQRMRAMPTLS